MEVNKMKKYNVSKIMRRAWEISRACYQNDGIRPVFSICLQMAWEETKAQSLTAEDVIAQWNAMETGAQMQMLQACVVKAAKNEIRDSVEDRYNSYNETVAWFLRHHGLDGLVNEAWLKLMDRLDPEYLDGVNERRAASGKNPLSLVALVYRSAKDAIRIVYRDDIKHGRAQVRTVVDKDGDEYQYIDTMVSSRADNTEISAMVNIEYRDFMNSLSDMDRQIIEAMTFGYKAVEIARTLSVGEGCISCPRRYHSMALS